MRRYASLLSLVLLLVCAGLFNQALAHELQPSSFEVRQLTSERYELIWRAPIYYGKPHPAKLQLPANWQTIGEPRVRRLSDSHLHRRVVSVPGGDIDGATIRFAGLEATITDVFVRISWLNGVETTAVARPGQPWFEIQGQRSTWQVAGDYTLLGIEHILSGYDHLTFVLALLLIVSGWRRLLLTVTSFTLAHSITLAAATLGLLWLPGPPIEATIALSILFLASELVKVCVVDPVPGQRTGKSPPWIYQPDCTLPLDRGFCFRLAAWLWFCRCTNRGGSAAKRNSTGAVNVQRRRGTGSANVHRGCSGADRGSAQDSQRLAILDSAITGLWYRWPGRFLVDRTGEWILSANSRQIKKLLTATALIKLYRRAGKITIGTINATVPGFGLE